MQIVTHTDMVNPDPGGFGPIRGGLETRAHPMVRVGTNFDHFGSVGPNGRDIFFKSYYVTVGSMSQSARAPGPCASPLPVFSLLRTTLYAECRNLFGRGRGRR